MRLTQRDDILIRFIARAGQASAGQIARLFFAANHSDSPCRDVLRRLTANNYLHRVERTIVGGTGGGSGQYVYSLGALGYRWVTPKGGKFTPARTVKPHTLGIVESYVSLVEHERAGRLQLRAVAFEPDSWQEVEGVKVRPDLHVELMTHGEARTWWLEIDTGTESQRDLAAKMNSILDAHAASGEFEVTDYRGAITFERAGLVPFPRVVFIVPDIERVREVEWVVGRLGGTAAELFTVLVAGTFPQAIL